MTDSEEVEQVEEKSFLQVIVHSFFIIPFLIAIFCTLLFGGVHLLTRENKSVYDYLEDVRAGGATKRWQAAFELSKILANEKLLPTEDKFYDEMASLFQHSVHDDNRVRQYLALAMGRSGHEDFVLPLIESLKDVKKENVSSIIYALGMLKDRRAVDVISSYLENKDARIRSIAVVALGNIGDEISGEFLKKSLNDEEANVQWGSALSLAHMGNNAGKDILLRLLSEGYLEQFSEVDSGEKKNLKIAAIDAAIHINDEEITKTIMGITQSDGNMKVKSAALAFLENQNNVKK